MLKLHKVYADFHDRDAKLIPLHNTAHVWVNVSKYVSK